MDSRLSNVPDARGRRVTFCVALAAFTFQFEAFVVIVALPAIAAHFHLSAAGAALVPVLYLTAAAAVFIPAGRWGDRHGLQCGFIAGVTLLLAGIGCVCLAPNAAALLAGRVLQGLGGGCMVALGYALIPTWLPADKTGAALGVVSFAAAAGQMAGAPVGGLLTSLLSWRWALLATVLLPVGLVFLAAWLIPPDPADSAGRGPPANWAGPILLAAWLAALLPGIGLGRIWGWTSARTLGLLGLAVVALAAFVRHEQTSAGPLVPCAIWRVRALPAALLTLGLVRATLGGMAFTIPFFVEAVCGKPPAVTGLVLLGYTAICAGIALQAGAWSDRVGSRRPILGATLTGAATCGALAASAPLANVWLTALWLAVLGIGAGLFFAPNNRFIMTCAPAGQTGAVAALLALALNIGTAVGVALFGALPGVSLVAAPGARFVPSFTLAALLFAAAAALSRWTYAPAKAGGG